MGFIPGPVSGPSSDDGDPIDLSNAQISSLREILLETLDHSPAESELHMHLPMIVQRIASNQLTTELLDRVEDLEVEIAETLLNGAAAHLKSIESTLPAMALPSAICDELKAEILSILNCLEHAGEIEDRLTELIDGTFSASQRQCALHLTADTLERCREFFAGAGGKFDASLIDPPIPADTDEDEEDEPSFAIDSIAEWKRSREAAEEPDEDDADRPAWNPDESKLEQLIFDLRRGDIDERDLEMLQQNGQEIAVALVMYAEDTLDKLADWAAESRVGNDVAFLSALSEAAQHLRSYQAVMDGDLDVT